jgi:3-oxoacyl-[acyl-carrier-protein] synthase III
MIRSRILGLGTYVPPRVWTNNDLSQLMDTSDEWIQQRTGIKQRHWVDQDSDTAASDLALEASLRAFESSGVKKEEIDCIILGTLSPDVEFPGTACFLQAKLGLPGVPAIDIRQQCTGFLYALSIADSFIKSGQYKKILVVGTEVHSKGLDKTTRGRDVAVLFGDGAGAAIVGRSPDGDTAQILSSHLHADGKYAKELWLRVAGMAHPGDRLTAAELETGDQYPRMNGKTVYVHAVKKMAEVLNEALTVNGFKLSDIDLLVPHQANLRINEAVVQQLKFPPEKVFNTIERFGNTTAATIPIGLDEAVKAGKLKPGMLVALVAFGSGFTWGATLIRW